MATRPPTLLELAEFQARHRRVDLYMAVLLVAVVVLLGLILH